jgi:hypothetical protein
VGLEPTLCCQNWILNPARLPFRHFGLRNLCFHLCSNLKRRVLSVHWAIKPRNLNLCGRVSPDKRCLASLGRIFRDPGRSPIPAFDLSGHKVVRGSQTQRLESQSAELDPLIARLLWIDCDVDAPSNRRQRRSSQTSSLAQERQRPKKSLGYQSSSGMKRLPGVSLTRSN